MSAAQAWQIRESRVTARTVMVVSSDARLRQRLKDTLCGLRWLVCEASGGAEAMVQTEIDRPEAIVIDSWLPDLEVGEFTREMGAMYPAMEVLRLDGSITLERNGMVREARSSRRNELLHAIRATQTESDLGFGEIIPAEPASDRSPIGFSPLTVIRNPSSEISNPAPSARRFLKGSEASLPEMVGESAPMLELVAMIRLVAPHMATVLIEGETGTGKEVVAKALHRLSARSGKPFVVLNCAAIPESLLEAELFGHTRGAFTGATQARTGRIEAAHEGTLFLDEIGEMPLALQAKMLRFLECGELQRVGDNETMRVDVRVIAATHQPLEQRAEERAFRLDLYHRLAVFPLEVPALRERMEDLPLLVEFFLGKMGKERPRKTISEDAMKKLQSHEWPGNVRELMHVLERGSILSADRAEIGADEVRTGRMRRA